MADYVVGMIHRARNRGGWATHIGVVDHLYGPNNELAWVRTLCGRTGRMYGKPKPEPEPGTCIWAKIGSASLRWAKSS